MQNRFYRKGELQDEKVLEGLSQAADLYRDGAITEAADILLEITEAIEEFEDNYDVRDE